MRTIHTQLALIILLGLSGLATSIAVAEDADFTPIFDGRTLDGWEAPDMWMTLN